MQAVPKISSKFIFSGHDTFHCRHLWLKKGYDYVANKKSFNDDDAVVELGVGKNMVSSIRYWMKAFNILTFDDKLTPFANALLADDGYDPYLEDEASLWLLHYQLLKNGLASTYSLIFNELRKEKVEFTKENYVSFIKRKAETEKSFTFNENTLNDDFSVLCRMYLRLSIHTKDKEEIFSGLLTELDLLKTYTKNKEDFFIIENAERPEIPEEVILYAILDDNDFDLSISLNKIESEYNSVGAVFALNRTGLLSKIESLTLKYPYIVFNDQAGIKELQFKKKPSPFSILDKYYAN